MTADSLQTYVWEKMMQNIILSVVAGRRLLFSKKFKYFKDFSVRPFAKMVEAKLEAVPNVDIDDEGVFKYVLIKVYAQQKEDGSEPSKFIVRGYQRCQWHSDIYDEVSSSVQGLGLDTECLGGGRIEHRPSDKKLKVYGYSQGFGKADHAESRNVLKTKYSDYEIEISDDGY